MVDTQEKTPWMTRLVEVFLRGDVAILLIVVSLPLPLIPEPVRETALGRGVTTMYLLAVAFAFYGWFWTHGGQTLGMRAWRLQVVRTWGGALSWRHALLRYSAAMVSWAVLGLGFLWVALSRRRLAWHDRWSGTRLLVLPRRS